ncbi:MAG TPA: hypothetical protein VGN61_04570, partial [Verrucomicrobiae bacterium]
VYLGFFYWMIYYAWHAGDHIGAAVLTAAMVALAVGHLIRIRGKDGMGILRVVAVHLSIAWAITLIALNWRLGVWIGGIPMETVHWLTLALLAWIGLVFAVTPSSRAIKFD